MRGGFALLLDQPREREHDRDAGHEDEQREDEVVEAQSLPLRMLELPSDNGGGRARDRALAGQHFGECLGGPVGTDDPEHGEAAQGIDRGDAALCRERFGGTTMGPLAPAKRRIVLLARARTSRNRIKSTLDAVLDGRSPCRRASFGSMSMRKPGSVNGWRK